MAVVTKTVLKSYFEDGKEPDENKYIDLIDSLVAEGSIAHGDLTGLSADDHPQYLLANGTRNLTGDLTITDDLTVNDDTLVKGGLSTGAAPPFTIPNGTIFVHEVVSTYDYGFVSAEGTLFLSSNTYYDNTDWRAIKVGTTNTLYIDAGTGLMFRADTTSRGAGGISTHVSKMTLSNAGDFKLAGGIVVGNVGGSVDNDSITFYQGATRVGEIGSDNFSFLKLNHITNLPIYTPRYMRVDGGLSATASISDPGDGNVAAQKYNIYETATLMGGLTCNDATWLRINQDADKNIYTPRFLAANGGLQSGGSTDPGDGYVGYTVGLRPNKNSTQYAAYGYHPLTTHLTSTSWDGDAKGNTGGQLIDLSVYFGVPAGVKAINVRILGKANNAGPTDGHYFFLGPSATYDAYGGVYVWGNVYMSTTAVISCDGNGDVYYTLSSSATCYCILRILGYWI